MSYTHTHTRQLYAVTKLEFKALSQSSAGLWQVCSAACGDFLHLSRSQVSLRPLWLEDIAQLVKIILSCCFAARKKYQK